MSQMSQGTDSTGHTTLEDLLIQRLITSSTLQEKLVQALSSTNPSSGVHPSFITNPSPSLGLEGAIVAAETESSVPNILNQPALDIDPVSATAEPAEFFSDFNPYLTDPLSEESWSPPKQMEDYIRDHFDRFLSEQERANIMVSLPRPQSDFLTSPQLDEEVRKFLAYDLKDKFLNNPLEPKLFSVQNLLLEVSGPLLCLWSNLLDETRTISRPEIIQIIQVSMVLLANASNSITVETQSYFI